MTALAWAGNKPRRFSDQAVYFIHERCAMNKLFTRSAFGAGLLLGAILLGGAARAQGERPVDADPPRHLEAGTTLKIKLLKDFNSATAHVGDRVRAEVADDDANDLPTGTLLFGHVTWIKPSGGSVPAEVDAKFDLERGDGPESVHDAASAHLKGPADGGHPEERAKKGASMGAGLGALLGVIIGRKHKLGDVVGGAILGALGGAAAGAVSNKRGGEVSLKSGDEITVHLDRAVTVGGEAY